MNHRPLPGRWLETAGGEAPPPFAVAGDVAVPMEVSSLDVRLDVDVAQRSATGRARLLFTLPQPGCPLLDLVPDPTMVVVDGQEVQPARLRLVTPPEETTPLRMLSKPLDAGVEHALEVEYPLREGPEGSLKFGGGGVQLGFFMSDLDQRGYLEKHAPANLEFDQFAMTLEVRIAGSSRAHRLFTNGDAEARGDGAWRVAFPGYFTSSSCYLHVTDRPQAVREDGFAGAEREVPVTVYGRDEAEVETALRDTLGLLRELEDTFGPYAHDRMLVYCTGNLRGGMEYAGAAMTDLRSLGHEIAHSWFARGVMPANGNAGWIDEAIAQWRDRGYPRAAAAPRRPPVNLAGFSPYRRHTPRESYDKGALLLGELDLLFAPGGGLRPLLAKLYREKRRRTLTTPGFQAFLERETGAELGAIFDRYVHGKDDGRGHEAHSHGEAASARELSGSGSPEAPPPAPRPFTAAELHSLL